MTDTSPAEINRENRRFWDAVCERQLRLYGKKYVRHFVRRRFADASPLALSDLYREVSFPAQVFDCERHFSAQQRVKAAEPRRKSAGLGSSRRKIIKHFSSLPEMLGRPTKSLWEPFFDQLLLLGLCPTRVEHPTELARWYYEYAGRRDRITITYRQFEKLVSELAPRRKGK
jgi:hypothetical protein